MFLVLTAFVHKSFMDENVMSVTYAVLLTVKRRETLGKQTEEKVTRKKKNKKQKHNMELNDISARNEIDFSFYIFLSLYLNKKYAERTIIAQ